MANTITTDDVRSYYNSLADFGLRHQFQGVRFDSGPNAGKTVFFDGTVKLPLHFVKTPHKLSQVVKVEPDAIEIPEPDWENRNGQYRMVFKVVDPSHDLPVEKLSDRNSKLMCNDDYYKESMKKLMAEYGY